MGVRYSPAQRRRLALKAKKRGIEAVAKQAGVKPGTVRGWCAEFGVGIGTGGSNQPMAAPVHGLDLPTTPAAGLDDSAGSKNVQGMGELIDKAGESLSCELSAWLTDAEGGELASERLGEVISDWETEHGTLTAEELDAARTQLFG